MLQGGRAEAAMNSYVSPFDDGEVLDLTRWPEGEDGAGGRMPMPADRHGCSRRFAWTADRFGVSWQLKSRLTF